MLVYLGLRVVLLALYARAWRANRHVRGFVGRYLGLYSVGALFWAVSLGFDGGVQYALVGLGIAVEVATPAVTYFTAPTRPQQVSHMPERFGLFTIIVLGEVVVAVVSGLADTEWSTVAVAAGFVSFLVAVAVWRLYFANVRETTISDILRGDRFDFLAGMGYTYGHFGVTLGITAAGAGVLLAIVAAAEGHGLGVLERLLVGGGVAVYLLGTAVTHGAVAALESHELAARVAAGVVAVAVAVAGPAPLVLLVAVAALLVAVVVFEEIRTPGGVALGTAD